MAALRMWGQTGDRPTVWIAAADPVYLEARLDHLRLHALHENRVSAAELRTIFDHLQETLADDAKYGFMHIGSCGYLRANEPIQTADVPPGVVDQQLPNEFMPSGKASAGYRNLRSEVEMALHGHDLNNRREAAGLPPINSLWFWGGGFAPQQKTRHRPPLFANDPILRGNWFSNTAAVDAWPGTIAACLDATVAGFVAVPSHDAEDFDWLEPCLHELRNALRARRLSSLTLIFADGHEAKLGRSDRWRFWRRARTLLN